MSLAPLRWKAFLELHGSPGRESIQPDETDGFIHLDRNENPYGPSAKVQECLRSAASIANRYPGPGRDALINVIAQTHKVNPEQIALGCGSSELLRAAATVFLGLGKKLITAMPTFEAMEYYARSVGAEVVALPLTSVFAHDLQRMRTRVDRSTGLIYICNPNNPTATLTARRDIEKFLADLLMSDAYVVIDEAYHHYAGDSDAYSSFLDRPVANDRVIVTRTFSQVYGLAGLRLGYAVGSPTAIQRVRAALTLDSVNSLVARSAIVALQDTTGTAEFIDRNENVRQEFFNQAGGRVLKPISSHANFVMMNAYMPADRVLQHFLKQGILLGPIFPSMPTYIRVSLGTAAQMKEFWRVWDLLPVGDMHM
jgi:histidinol-phosphate aminotransferase